MLSPSPSSAGPVPTALIVERHRLIVPFLRSILSQAGFRSVSGRATAPTLRRVRPDAVVLCFDGLAARPLETVRRTRATMPAARIVVITRTDDPAWNALARALGADTILGPSADGRALSDAVIAP